MLKYTICFIKRGNSILLLNREYPAWMGIWNGVGGKIEEGETPLTCILREVKEETNITLDNVRCKGHVTWENVDGSSFGGMHVYLAELPEDHTYETPIKVREGILDWKKIDWILHPDNNGVANLQYFLPLILGDPKLYRHRFVYNGEAVEDFQSIVIEHQVHMN